MYDEVQRLPSGHAQFPVINLNTSAVDGALSISTLLSELPSADDEERARRSQLIDAGYSDSDAAWLVQRESELMLSAIEARHLDNAPRGSLDYLNARLAARRASREELGDYSYEQYLLASGQSTRLAVTQVVPGSPAAGIQTGDEIVNYGGKRVFGIFDLGDESRDGASAKLVVVDILREGAAMQLVVPRGPLGIAAGRPRDALSSH